MLSILGGKKDPERQARLAIRRRKWGQALVYYEGRLQANERDFALWNLVGDLQMNNGARAQAVEAWRRALEGYALEGLHENVLGIARKVLRRAPQENDVYLLVAEACLGLEYHADCLAALRSYIKLTKQRSEADLRALFKKLLDSSLHHVHLLEELKAIFRDSGVDDPELATRVAVYIDQHTAAQSAQAPAVDGSAPAAAANWDGPYSGAADPQHMMGLDGLPNLGSDLSGDLAGGFHQFEVPSAAEQAAFGDQLETPVETGDLKDGEGKDHFDLGMVYKDMKLWDAAVAEFEQARRDASIRVRATLALSECLQENDDLAGALDLLERERLRGCSTAQEQMNVELQIGALHESLGNLEDALAHFEAVRACNSDFGDVADRIADLKQRLTNA